MADEKTPEKGDATKKTAPKTETRGRKPMTELRVTEFTFCIKGKTYRVGDTFKVTDEDATSLMESGGVEKV